SSLQRDGIRERGRDSGSGNHPHSHQEASKDPRQVLEGDLKRRQEDHLGSSSTKPTDPPEANPEQGNRELRERVEPLGEKKKVFPAPPKNKKRPKSAKRNQPRQSGSNRPDRTHSNYNRDPTRSTNSRNRNHSNTSRDQGRPNNNPRQTHSNHQGNNKRHREESEDLEDEVRWRKVHRATAVLGASFATPKGKQFSITPIQDFVISLHHQSQYHYS
ncbi:hypothetical protein KEM48_003671, partial [Puccinia striiformis f. sp. tritici PST-130]